MILLLEGRHVFTQAGVKSSARVTTTRAVTSVVTTWALVTLSYGECRVESTFDQPPKSSLKGYGDSQMLTPVLLEQLCQGNLEHHNDWTIVRLAPRRWRTQSPTVAIRSVKYQEQDMNVSHNPPSPHPSPAPNYCDTSEYLHRRA